jgi:TRAP-type mannitol/chloroaromatic compound transport system permease small subunit
MNKTYIKILLTLLFIINTLIINVYLVCDYLNDYRIGKTNFTLLLIYMIISLFVFGDLVLKKDKHEVNQKKRNNAHF